MEAWVSNLNVNPERANPGAQGWTVSGEGVFLPASGGAGMSQELPLQFTPRLGSTAPNQQFRVKICKTHRYQTVRPFTVLALNGLEHLWEHPPEVKRGAAHNRARNGSVCCQDRTQTVRPAARLLASSRQSNFFCFLRHGFRVYGLLGQPLTDINSSPELSPSLATAAPRREGAAVLSLLWHRVAKNRGRSPCDRRRLSTRLAVSPLEQHF